MGGWGTPGDRLPGFMVIPKLIKRKVTVQLLPPRGSVLSPYKSRETRGVCDIGRQTPFPRSFCIYKTGTPRGYTETGRAARRQV